MLQFLLAKMMGLVVLCAVSMTLSTYVTQSASATLGLMVAFGSPMILRALVMGYETSPPGIQLLFKILNAILPQITLFDLSGRVVNSNWPPVPAWVLWSLAGYMALYSAAMVTLSWTKFRKQAV